MTFTGYNLPQPPRFDIPEGQEDVKTLSHFLTNIVQWAEQTRRLLQRVIPHYRQGTATYDPGNLVDGAGVTTTVTVTGATLGDSALASFSLDLQGVILYPWVSAADTVSVRFQNETGGAVDLASGTITAWAYTPPNASA